MEHISKIIEAEVRRLQAQAVIRHAVITRTMLTYVPLAQTLKMFSGSTALAEMLGAIMAEDHSHGRPLSCAIVVGVQSGKPGRGFFDMARRLGYQVGNTQQAEEAFWKSQLTALGF